MKILLVNPNRYRTPPVPPLALEYLSSGLRGSGHQARLLDLCFADFPENVLDREMESFQPQVAGFTIRNIDTALYNNNVFFLDEIKALLERVKSHCIPVIAGGAGYSFSPRGVLEYLGATWGIWGSGEKALVRFLDTCEKNPPQEGEIIDGWEYAPDPDLEVTGRGTEIDYGRYVAEGGIIGFETQKGCLADCSFCPEGSGRMIYRRPQRVVDELRELAGRGFREFHLCDSEFNQNLDFCLEFLALLASQGPEISWALYMKPVPYDEELFRLLKRSGANLITLSLQVSPKELKHAREISRLCRKHGIRLAVDFLCGLPGETLEEVRGAIENLRSIRPDTVGVNSFVRLCPGTGVTREISGSDKHRKHVLGDLNGTPPFISPVFYNIIPVEALREMIGDDPLFRIEGFERSTNYQRLREAP